MQVSLNWLNELVDLKDLDVKQIAHELTMSGLEVEEIEEVRPKFTNIITARIEKIKDDAKDFKDEIQPRFVFRLDIKDKTEEEVMAFFLSIHIVILLCFCLRLLLVLLLVSSLVSLLLPILVIVESYIFRFLLKIFCIVVSILRLLQISFLFFPPNLFAIIHILHQTRFFYKLLFCFLQNFF